MIRTEYDNVRRLQVEIATQWLDFLSGWSSEGEKERASALLLMVLPSALSRGENPEAAYWCNIDEAIMNVFLDNSYCTLSQADITALSEIVGRRQKERRELRRSVLAVEEQYRATKAQLQDVLDAPWQVQPDAEQYASAIRQHVTYQALSHCLKSLDLGQDLTLSFQKIQTGIPDWVASLKTKSFTRDDATTSSMSRLPASILQLHRTLQARVQQLTDAPESVEYQWLCHPGVLAVSTRCAGRGHGVLDTYSDLADRLTAQHPISEHFDGLSDCNLLHSIKRELDGTWTALFSRSPGTTPSSTPALSEFAGTGQLGTEIETPSWIVEDQSEDSQANIIFAPTARNPSLPRESESCEAQLERAKGTLLEILKSFETAKSFDARDVARLSSAASVLQAKVAHTQARQKQVECIDYVLTVARACSTPVKGFEKARSLLVTKFESLRTS